MIHLAIFKSGDVVRTRAEMPAKIIECIYEGVYSEVYSVDYAGRKKLLKWFVCHEDSAERLYKSLMYMREKRKPDGALMWPEAITECPGDFSVARGRYSFGYITEPCPEGYISMTGLMCDSTAEMTFLSAVDACLKLISLFRKLHKEGFCFENIDEGNLFINPYNGDIRLIGCDRLVLQGDERKTGRNMRFCAPEMFGKNRAPSEATDLYSLAVLVFFLLFRRHPLAETREGCSLYTQEMETRIYVHEPVFAPKKDEGTEQYRAFLETWESMPDYIKDIFGRAFGDGIFNPESRVTEGELIRCLVRLRSEIRECDFCGFAAERSPNALKCSSCSEVPAVEYMFTFFDGVTAAADNKVRVYRCMVGPTDADTALEPVGVVVRNSSGVYAMRNKSDKDMEYTYDGETVQTAPPNGLICFEKGVEIRVMGCSFTVTAVGGGTE